MDPDLLLRDVPTVEEWFLSAERSPGLVARGAAQIEAAYLGEFQFSMPAFDEARRPVTPPVEHILDAFARNWVPAVEEAARGRAEFGTVAIVTDRVSCDVCDWGAARYETLVGPARAQASLCLCCMSRHGDPFLGAGRSVLMLLPSEIPDTAVRTLRPHVTGDWSSWTEQSLNDGWDPYRRWGFSGPDESGRLYAFIHNVQLSVSDTSFEAVKLVAQRTGDRHMYMPGGDSHYGPRGLDDLDARAFLLDVLRSELHAPSDRGVLERHFAVPPSERDARASAALERGYNPSLRIGDLRVCESADYQMCRSAAEHSDDPRLLRRLAEAHFDLSVRFDAVANPALDAGALAALAAKCGAALAGALLARDDLRPETTGLVVEALMLEGRLDRYAMHQALPRPDFPEHLVSPVTTRIAEGGTEARAELAGVMHGAPAHRRDAVHLQLLARARRIKSTVDLIDAVVGEDVGRMEWIANRPEWKIRSLADWRRTQLEQEASAKEVDQRSAPPAATLGPSIGNFAPTAPAVSARLRRWWIRDAMADVDLLASDLGDALVRCKLVRVGSQLRIMTPYMFGLGSPVEAPVQKRLLEALGCLSAGAIQEIVWEYQEDGKATSRKRSTSMDIYEPGDPAWSEYPAIAADLWRHLSREFDGRALAAVGRLRLAGVNRHRVWFAAPRDEDVRAIGTTPGAAASLKIAVAKFQKRPPAEGLYELLTDPGEDTLAWDMASRRS